MTTTPTWLARQDALIGAENTARLAAATVMVVGLGGVGGHAAETLLRCGVGRLILVDFDTVAASNRNRQLFATAETVGMPKTDAAVARLLQVAPEAELIPLSLRVTAENARTLFETYHPTAVIDAVDDVPAKVALAVAARDTQTYLVAAMGTGNKLHPERLMLGDISKTAYCPLAKAVRLALRRVGITHLPVVWSDEEPVHVGTRTPASIAFVPPTAGLILSSAVVNLLLENAHA